MRPAIMKLYQLRLKVTASSVSVSPDVSASCVSVASQADRFKCISYVPMCLLHVYQLRLKLTASSVSVTSRCVCFLCISCVSR